MAQLLRGIFAVVCLFASSGYAQQSGFYEPMHILSNNQIIQNGLFNKPTLSFAEYEKAYQQGEFHDYESFVDFLLKKSPRLKDRSVLVHRSESQQLSSFDHPRVLLFDGGTIFGLSEYPGRHRRVEMLETTPGTYEVNLREIVFDQQTGSVQFAAQPRSCLACHGSPAKPLWNPYDFWPNAIGSAIGFIGSEKEEQAYQKIRSNAATSPLLSRLNLPPKFTQTTEDITAFTQTIQQINLGRWIQENLPPEKFSKAYAYPLMAVLSYCTKPPYSNNGLETADADFGASKLAAYFRPDEKFQHHPTLQTIGQDIHQNRQGFKNFLDTNLREIFPQDKITFPVTHARLQHEEQYLAQMRWILSLAGIDASNMTTSLYANDYLISSPANAPLDFLTTLYEIRPDLFENMQIIPQNFGTYNNISIIMNCQEMQQQSLQAQREPQVATWTPAAQISNSLPVVSRCAKCHIQDIADSEKLAPAIPFHRVNEFAKLLMDPKKKLKEKILNRIEASGDKQMPPGIPLTASEKAALKEYLENLTP